MQFPWLEELVKEGHLNEKTRDGIYADCDELVKSAIELGPKSEAAAEKLEKFLKPLIAGGLFYLGNKGIGALKERSQVNAHFAEVAKVRDLVLAKFPEDPTKAGARFDEIASLAPTVARNENLMHRLMAEKVHSGLTSADINHLAIIQASYTPNYSFQSKLTKKAAAEKLGEMTADMVMICGEGGIKTAAFGGAEIRKALAFTTMLSAAPLLGSLGIGVANQLSDSRNKAIREKKLIASFEEAMNPKREEDRDILHANREKARQAFQTLAHFAPSIALQPDAARSFMKKLVEYKGNIQTGDLKDLTEIERNMRGAGSSPFAQGFAKGTEALGLQRAVSTGIGTVAAPYAHSLESEFAAGMGLEPAHPKFQRAGQGGHKSNG